uniref:Reverse transcriptase domain-containing protein n=1 Tax=Haemonchus contortus TaxID=6289 RepID=A0A7I5E992_HAECO
MDGHSSKQGSGKKSVQIDHIHTVARLTELSREYRMPLCLTFIDLKKASDIVEIEVGFEAVGNQGVPTQCIRMLHELYDNFITRISPFYEEVIVNMERGWGSQRDEQFNPELSRRKLAAGEALENIEGVVKKTKNILLHADLFDTAVLPALRTPRRPGIYESRTSMLPALLNALWKKQCSRFSYARKCRRESEVPSFVNTKIRNPLNKLRAI